MTARESKMLDELLTDDSDTLSDWEIDFIESMDKKRRLDLSDRESAKLIQVWDKAFG